MWFSWAADFIPGSITAVGGNFPAFPAVTGDFIAGLAESPAWLQACVLACATLLSEDLTAISGGILAGAAPDNLPAILIGCWCGMWAGDMIYFIIGYVLGRPALSLPVLKKIISEKKFDTATGWFSKKGLHVLLASRVLPGTRPATYIAAGVLRFRPARFIAISLTLSFLWALLLIFVSMRLGAQLMALAEGLHLGLLSPILTILLILALILLLAKLPGKRWKDQKKE